MDPVTHAASGAALMLALPRRPATRWAIPLAAAVAAAPDLDIILASGPLQFLQLHRGFTHALVYVPLLALLCTLLARPLWKRDTPGHWPAAGVWLLCCGLLLLHIWLDCITTYGTMIFLPFSAERVRLNAVFIIDLLLTLPLLSAAWYSWRAGRRLPHAPEEGLPSAPRAARLALAWCLLYPCLALLLNGWQERQLREDMLAAGRQPGRMVILPDAFAPIFWRALYEEHQPNGLVIRADGLTMMGRVHARGFPRPALPASLRDALMAQSQTCTTFLDFSLLPVCAPLPAPLRPKDAVSSAALTTQEDAAAHPQELRGYLQIADERFGSSLRMVQRLMRLRAGGGGPPFQLWVELGYGPDGQPQLLRERLRLPDSGRDSGWNRPRVPSPPALLPWSVGLY